MTKLVVALDCTPFRAIAVIKGCAGIENLVWKVGPVFLNAGGFERAAAWANFGAEVFIDQKLHDIPSVVQTGVEELAAHHFSFVTVHADRQVMEAAVKGRNRDLKILAVTVLTSMRGPDLEKTGITHYSVRDLVMFRADQAIKSGVDGIVCSYEELEAVRPISPPGFLLVVPGIRVGSIPPPASDDQKRTATAAEAVAAGATHLVVGRQIVSAPDPGAAVEEILGQMGVK